MESPDGELQRILLENAVYGNQDTTYQCRYSQASGSGFLIGGAVLAD